MKIGLIIPWRETSSRIKPLKMVLDWYKINLPNIEIFYADRPGKYWNAAASRNDGVKKAQKAHCDVIIVNDADTIPEIKPLLEAIQACQEDEMIHNPYTLCKYFNKEITNQIINGKDMTILKHNLFLDANGGVWVCTPKTWWSIGGMDEKFLQWGGEDLVFEIAHKIIKGKNFIKHNGYIYCLGHDKQQKEKDFSLNHSKNTELCLKYYSISDSKAMLSLVKQKES